MAAPGGVGRRRPAPARGVADQTIRDARTAGLSEAEVAGALGLHNRDRVRRAVAAPAHVPDHPVVIVAALVVGGPLAGPPPDLAAQLAARGMAVIASGRLAYEMAREGHIVVEVDLRGGLRAGGTEVATMRLGPDGRPIYRTRAVVPLHDGRWNVEGIAVASAAAAAAIV